MITYIDKDITTVGMGVLAHGVNCQGVMGSGVARAIRDKWPEVYETYAKLPTGKTMLGTCHLVNVNKNHNDQLFVANCFTQVFYGHGGKFADTQAIEDSLWGAYQWADYYHLDLFMPKIGAGLGGLSWEKDVLPVVEYADSKWCRTDTFVCVWGE